MVGTYGMGNAWQGQAVRLGGCSRGNVCATHSMGEEVPVRVLRGRMSSHMGWWVIAATYQRGEDFYVRGLLKGERDLREGL